MHPKRNSVSTEALSNADFPNSVQQTSSDLVVSVMTEWTALYLVLR